MTQDTPPKVLEGFDRVFPLIGGHHLYQWLLLLIVSFQRGIVVFHHIGYIFLGASPNHWCAVDELTNSSWTAEQIKNISIPKLTSSHNGDSIKYEDCEYYDLNYNQLIGQKFEDAYASINFTMATRRECDHWIYDQSVYQSTVVTEFDLVCNRKSLAATIQATYMAGIFVGSLILGSISDKILGRRKTCLLCIAVIITFGFGTAFATTYLTFILFRFFIAIGVAGSGQNCFTILMEYSDASCRATLGIATQVAFALVYMLMPLYAYLIRGWTDLQLAFSISTLTLITYYWILPESSRWLAQNGREEEALDILERIAKRNKQPKPSRAELKEILRSSCQVQQQQERLHSDVKSEKDPPIPPIIQSSKSTKNAFFLGLKKFLSSYVSLVKTPELRKRSLLIWFLYMSMSFTYYGVSFGSPDLSSDPFIIVFLGGLMELPGYFGVIPAVQYWGRKPTTVTTFLVAGLAYICIPLIPLDLSAIRITLAMISKLFISGCSAIIILLASELYPTEARSTGLGSAVLFGRIGSITAPYIVKMKFSYEQTSIVIIGIMSIVASLVALMLPETKGEEMFEKVDIIENVVQRRRSLDGSFRRQPSTTPQRSTRPSSPPGHAQALDHGPCDRGGGGSAEQLAKIDLKEMKA